MSPKYRECLLSLTAVTSPHCVFFQEDISKLRRKIEKAKKPAEKISNGDDILNEEINDYKVRPSAWHKVLQQTSLALKEGDPMSLPEHLKLSDVCIASLV